MYKTLGKRTLLDVGSGDQSCVTGRCSYEHARCFSKAPSFRHGLQSLLCARNMSRISTLTCAKDLIADLVQRRTATWQRRGSLRDYARELGTGDPWKRRLVLVFAANLQQVEEIGCGCVDDNQVLVVFGSGVWERLHLEVFWALISLAGGRCTGVEYSTFTYSLI